MYVSLHKFVCMRACVHVCACITLNVLYVMMNDIYGVFLTIHMYISAQSLFYQNHFSVPLLR